MRLLSDGEFACSSASRALVQAELQKTGVKVLRVEKQRNSIYPSNQVEEVQLHWPLVAPVGCERGTRVVWNPFKCAEFTVVHCVLTVLQVFNDP